MFAAEHSRQHLHSRIGKYRNLHRGVLYQKRPWEKGKKAGDVPNRHYHSLLIPKLQLPLQPFPNPDMDGIIRHATTSQPYFGSNTRTTRFRLNHPTSLILQTKPLSNLIPTSTKKTGAKSSVQSPLQAKCRASSTQRSRSRVTFVIFPATPRPVPSKNRQMFNFQDSHFGKTDLFSQNAKRPFYNAFVGCVPTDLMRDAS